MSLGTLKLIIKSIVLTLLGLIAVGLLYWLFFAARWDWIPTYMPLLLNGLRLTLLLLVLSVVMGFLLAIPIGLVQVTGPNWLASIARGFCTVIRGTPLLVQLYLIYYGLGSLFPQFPWIRESWAWPILRQAWPYAVLALTMSVAGYEGEVMRGAFKGVPGGQLEAARAMGMPRYKSFFRIWLPQALHRALPTIGGETVLQMKSTPLVATITVVDIYSLSKRVTQDTFIVYEPLLLLAVVYMIMAGLIVLLFRWLERRVPSRTA